MLLGNASRGKIVAKRVVDAPAGWARLFALRRGLPEGTAVRFRGAAFWVPFGRRPVDVAFLDRAGRVVGIVANLRAWRGARTEEDAVEAIALEAASCERVPVKLGDRLEFTPLTSERVAAGAKPPESF